MSEGADAPPMVFDPFSAAETAAQSVLEQDAVLLSSKRIDSMLNTLAAGPRGGWPLAI